MPRLRKSLKNYGELIAYLTNPNNQSYSVALICDYFGLNYDHTNLKIKDNPIFDGEKEKIRSDYLLSDNLETWHLTLMGLKTFLNNLKTRAYTSAEELQDFRAFVNNYAGESYRKLQKAENFVKNLQATEAQKAVIFDNFRQQTKTNLSFEKKM